MWYLGRRTGVVLGGSVVKDSDGFDDVDAFWDAVTSDDRGVQLPSRPSVAVRRSRVGGRELSWGGGRASVSTPGVGRGGATPSVAGDSPELGLGDTPATGPAGTVGASTGKGKEGQGVRRRAGEGRGSL